MDQKNRRWGSRKPPACLGRARGRVRQYIREGKIARVRIGRRVLVEPAELERLVEAGRSGLQVTGKEAN